MLRSFHPGRPGRALHARPPSAKSAASARRPRCRVLRPHRPSAGLLPLAFCPRHLRLGHLRSNFLDLSSRQGQRELTASEGASTVPQAFHTVIRKGLELRDPARDFLMVGGTVLHVVTKMAAVLPLQKYFFVKTGSLVPLEPIRRYHSHYLTCRAIFVCSKRNTEPKKRRQECLAKEEV